MNISYPSTTIDWNAEDGYKPNVPPDAVPWRPYGAGLYYGLTLVLDVETDEYYCSSTAGAGFKVHPFITKILFSILLPYFAPHEQNFRDDFRNNRRLENIINKQRKLLSLQVENFK